MRSPNLFFCCPIALGLAVALTSCSVDDADTGPSDSSEALSSHVTADTNDLNTQKNLWSRQEFSRPELVYCLGTCANAAKLPKNKFDVKKIANKKGINKSRYILLLDGLNDYQTIFEEEIAASTPVIVLGEPQTLGAKELMSQIGNFPAINRRPRVSIPVVAEEGSPEPVVAKNEFVIDDTVSGYMYFPQTGFGKTFSSIAQDPGQAAELGLSWAVAKMRERDNFRGTRSLAYWKFYWEVMWSSADYWEPYGRLNIQNNYYWLVADGNDDYEWYNTQFKIQSVPGYGIYSSNWRTDNLYNSTEADAYYDDGELIDYGPGTTSGGSTVGVEVGVTVGFMEASVSASMSWSYSKSDVMVVDQSDFYTDKAYWKHEINELQNVGKYTYMAEPGVTVRTPAWGFWGPRYGEEWYKIEWWKPGWIAWAWVDWQYL